MQRKKGILLTVLGGICWGFSGACGQYLFQQKAFTPLWMASFRLPTAGILILLYLACKNHSIRVLFTIWKEPEMAARMIAFAFLGMLANQYSYFMTVSLSNAGTATVLEYLSPLILIVFAIFKEKKLPSPLKMTALILALSGVFILATHGNVNTMIISREVLVYGLLSAVTYALSSTLPEKIMDKYGSIYTVGWGMLIGGMGVWLVHRPWEDYGTFDWGAIGALMGMVLIGSIASYLWYMQGVHMIGAQLANLLACVEPISATIFAVIWLKPDILKIDLIGFILIIAAVIAVSLGEKTTKRQGG